MQKPMIYPWLIYRYPFLRPFSIQTLCALLMGFTLFVLAYMLVIWENGSSEACEFGNMRMDFTLQ